MAGLIAAVAVDSAVAERVDNPRLVEDSLSGHLFEGWIMDQSREIVLVREFQGLVMFVEP
jgi:hypothetical protein